MWYVVYIGCAESAEEVQGGVDVMGGGRTHTHTHTHTHTVVVLRLWSGGILNWAEEYMGWIFSLRWDFGYPHLYTLYPFRIAVNTL